MNLLEISDELARCIATLSFAPPVSHVYNPLEYARAPHARYLELYGAGTREVLVVGMNPGPFGMAQTGVPFGDVTMVRDWLRVDAPVGHPAVEHPKRPIDGFRCSRSEVSGTRLWGWARDRFETPNRFFARFFVANYCPLCFMETSGRNLTPDKLPSREREPLFAACDRALLQLAQTLRPRYVFGVGGFAETRARTALSGLDVTIDRIPHPSPASPAANRGWAPLVEAVLNKHRILT